MISHLISKLYSILTKIIVWESRKKVNLGSDCGQWSVRLICNSLECWKNKKFTSVISSFHTRNPTSKYLFSSHRGMNQEIDIQHFIFCKKNVQFFRKDFIIWTLFLNLYWFDCAILFIISTHSASTSVYKNIMNELHTYLAGASLEGERGEQWLP